MNAWGTAATLIGVFVGIITLIKGLREYRRAQQWKRSEFLVAEVDRFFANSRVATALLLIDYSRIQLEPDGRRAAAFTPQTLTLDDKLMTGALRVHTEFTDETESFTPPEMLAREAFDEVLTGFERFDHHIQIGLIDVADAKVYLGYWVEKLADVKSGWKPREFYVALAGFVEEYEYRGAARLFKAFGHPLPAHSKHRTRQAPHRDRGGK